MFLRGVLVLRRKPWPIRGRVLQHFFVGLVRQVDVPEKSHKVRVQHLQYGFVGSCRETHNVSIGIGTGWGQQKVTRGHGVAPHGPSILAVVHAHINRPPPPPMQTAAACEETWQIQSTYIPSQQTKRLRTHLVNRRDEAEIDDLRGNPVSPVAHHRCSVIGSELVLDLQKHQRRHSSGK